MPVSREIPGGYHQGKYIAPGAKAPKRASKAQRAMVERIVASSADSVTALPQPILNKFIPILRAAHDEVAKELIEWLQEEEGSNRFTAQRLRSAYAQIRGSLEELGRLNPALVEALDNVTARTQALALSNVQKELARLEYVFEGSITPLNIDQAVVFARGDRLVLERFERSARMYNTWARGAVKRELAVGYLRGSTISQLADRLYSRLPAVFEHAKHRAERLARTEAMNAYNTYHHETIKEVNEINPDIMMRWDASMDSRLCPQCASLDGMIVDVDNKFRSSWSIGPGKVISQVVDRPPAHPNCRCVLIPWKEDWPEVERWEGY